MFKYADFQKLWELAKKEDLKKKKTKTRPSSPKGKSPKRRSPSPKPSAPAKEEKQSVKVENQVWINTKETLENNKTKPNLNFSSNLPK